jgi:tRNA uridine 5-carboxymethylaminomethyl modification enzyme
MFNKYDIIVIGGGHAGCEAAAAASRLGSTVLLVTMNMTQFAQMSCNPSMGGVAKGQIVREIDALGGLSGIVTDESMIQFRMLNKSKGPAMWSPRAQNDRNLFSVIWRKKLEGIERLYFLQDIVEEILEKNERVIGIKTRTGRIVNCKSVIVTTGTFLNGNIHIGELNFKGGRLGDFSSIGLTECLKKMGFISSRMKTGTPVRIDGRSIDFSKLIEQRGDDIPGKFSYKNTRKLKKQKSCWLAYTNDKVHDVLRTGFDKSPMFQGRIKGVGPRYCPSIEDKIERFSGRNRHQLFVEPEGWSTVEYYLNGFSSSLPEKVQYDALRLVEGFKEVRIFRPGYAIEYDYFPPVQLKANLETKRIENLFLAGQINGTTGYEEAACQGLIAGINAHLKITGMPPFELKRSEAYIGVLIDDLITKGIEEPYRMFTSRAEYRILLRQDNADRRLTKRSFDIGLAERSRYYKCRNKILIIDQLVEFIKNKTIEPDEVNALLSYKETPIINQKVKLEAILLRPEILLKELISEIASVSSFINTKYDINNEIIEEAEILIKYENYIEKENDIAEKIIKLENIELFENFDYQKLKSLTLEAREKLSRIKPRTLGQASRIAGVSPADISVLIVYLGR